MFVLIEPRMRSKMGRVGSNTRSLGHILEKTLCTPYRQQFQSDYHETWSECLSYEISDEFENGSCQLKNLVIRPNLKKTLCTHYRQLFSLIIMKLGQKVCLNEISDEFENGSCPVKN